MHNILNRHRSDGILIPFKIFRILFPKSTIAALHVTKNNSIILKTYNQSSIEQLVVCTERLRHKGKNCQIEILLVPQDSPFLLGMQDIKLLDILKVLCEMMEDPDESRKLNLRQCRHPAALAAKQTKCNRSREIIQM